MAMETVDQHLITQFSDMMHIKAQQSKARLRPYCMLKRLTGDRFAYDGLGTVEARELTARFSATEFDDLDHFRRRIVKRRFSVTLPVDKNDLEGRLTDPSGEYAQAALNAMERVFDRVVYDAMFADVATGRDFETTVTFAGEGGLTVNATAGLTLAKLLEAKANFIDNEVGNEAPVQMCMGISGDEHTTLLQIATLTSGDYTRQFALEKGELVRAVGIDLIPFGASVVNPVLSVSSGTRTSFVMASNAMCVAIARDWEITVKDRPDYVDTKQIQITGALGAVRTEAKLIQKLTTTDA